MRNLTAPLRAAVFERAGLDDREPPVGGAAGLAARLFGSGNALVDANIAEPAWVTCDDGRRRIGVSPSLALPRANYGIALAIAVEILRRERWAAAMIASQRARLARLLAACLVAPQPFVVSFLEEHGHDAEGLADACCITLTCATLRIAEVQGADAVIATPSAVYRRGELLAWMSDDDVRALARRPTVRSVRRVVLADEPDHVALMRVG